jgi:hypothetical protein
MRPVTRIYSGKFEASNHIASLMMMTEMTPKTLVPFEHLTKLMDREDIFEFSRGEIFK